MARDCACCGVNLKRGDGQKCSIGWLCVVCHEKACRMYVVIRNEFFTIRKEKTP